MKVYLLMIVIVFILSSACTYYIDEENRMRITGQSSYLLYGITLIFTLIAGLRYGVGADFYSYYKNYEFYANDAINIIKENEIGIRLIARVAKILNDSPQTYIFLCSFITIILFMISIRKNSENIKMSVLLYVFLGMFLGSFNAIRQYLACAVIFFGITYILNGKAWKWILCVLLAYFCHTSAILLLPLYWLVRMKNTKRFLLIVAVVAIVAYFSYDRLFGIVDAMKGLEDRSVADRVYAQGRVNLFRVLVSWAPVLLSFFPERVFNIGDEKDRILTKFAIVAAALQTVSMNSTYLARFCTYTTATSIITIPMLLAYQGESNRKILQIVIPFLYFIYWTAEATGLYVVNYQWCF